MISQTEIDAGQKLTFNKEYSFKPISTRKYYSGTHFISLIINGKEFEKSAFELE